MTPSTLLEMLRLDEPEGTAKEDKDTVKKNSQYSVNSVKENSQCNSHIVRHDLLRSSMHALIKLVGVTGPEL